MSLVSIIIPCYNYGWLLAETLNSVLAQTHQDWECIIVDDGSTDNTRSVAEKYQAEDSRFRYIFRENGGLPAARNTGIRQASGTYLQLLDADDLLAPRKLELQVSLLDAQPEIDILYGDVRYFLDGEPAVLSYSFDMQNVPWMSNMSGQGAAVLAPLITQNQFVVNSPLIRIAIIRRVGLFAEHLRSLEDWDFWLRCALSGACFQYDDRPEMWALVRVHSASLSQNRLKMRFFEEQMRSGLVQPLRTAGVPEAQVYNNQSLQQLRYDNAVYNLTQGRIKEGLSTYWDLARESGNYLSYAKGALYWLVRRVRTAKT